jgi:hypothetical protein
MVIPFAVEKRTKPKQVYRMIRPNHFRCKGQCGFLQMGVSTVDRWAVGG